MSVYGSYRMSRRNAIGAALASPLLASPIGARRRVPVIDVTDLYHPPQDPGDNVDLVTAFGLPELDLLAVIFDVTQSYRRPFRDADRPEYSDPSGPRDPGYIPLTQLNSLFGRQVPGAPAPFTRMRSPEDAMQEAPAFEQSGIALLLDTLRRSREPVEIVSFGSCRPIAVALNRDPDLVRRKTRRVHVCAGTYPAGYLEWNVRLDPHAFVRVLRSDLPVALYPCATPKGPFDLGEYNCYWKMPDLQWIRDCAPGLRRYLVYALSRSPRLDFLNALEEDPSEETMRQVCAHPHNVWETAVWLAVSGRKLVRRADGKHAMVPADTMDQGLPLVSGALRPCDWHVEDSGDIRLLPPRRGTRRWIYHRPDPVANEAALREAVPAMYQAFLWNV